MVFDEFVRGWFVTLRASFEISPNFVPQAPDVPVQNRALDSERELVVTRTFDSRHAS